LALYCAASTKKRRYCSPQPCGRGDAEGGIRAQPKAFERHGEIEGSIKWPSTAACLVPQRPPIAFGDERGPLIRVTTAKRVN